MAVAHLQRGSLSLLVYSPEINMRRNASCLLLRLKTATSTFLLQTSCPPCSFTQLPKLAELNCGFKPFWHK